MDKKIAFKIDQIKARFGQRRYKFLRELTRPIRTWEVKLQEVSRSAEGGIFRAGIVEPLASELAMIEVVGEISGVGSRNSLAHNLGVIQLRIAVDTEELGAALSNIKTKISTHDLNAAFDVVTKEIDVSIWAVQCEEQAIKSVKKAKEIVEKNNHTVFGILRARTEFEQWVERQRPAFFRVKEEKFDEDESDAVVYIDERAFSEGDRALLISAELVSAALNDLIITNMPYSRSAELLRKRPILISAVKNIMPKVTAQREKMIRRKWYLS